MVKSHNNAFAYGTVSWHPTTMAMLVASYNNASAGGSHLCWSYDNEAAATFMVYNNYNIFGGPWRSATNTWSPDMAPRIVLPAALSTSGLRHEPRNKSPLVGVDKGCFFHRPQHVSLRVFFPEVRQIPND